MPLDSNSIANRLKAKVAKEKEGDGDAAEEKVEGDSPGAMALRAIKSGDAEALEEAIRACVDKTY